MPRFETLCTGYGLIEGPRDDGAGGLYFSDVLGGGVFHRSADGEVTTVVPKRRGVGGIALHADGGILISGRDLSHVVVTDGVASSRTVWKPDAPGLNDLLPLPDGRVVTGTIRADPFSTSGERVAGECVAVAPGGAATVLYDGVSLSNGIGLSPDGSKLFHSDTASHHVIVHDLDDGVPVRRRALTSSPSFNPDGLAVDEAGTVWVADYGAGRVVGLSPDGEGEQSIEIPAGAVTSLCFGGDDRRDLYVVSADNTDDPSLGGCVFRTRVDVPGVAVAAARI
jgi:gluconolactonase